MPPDPHGNAADTSLLGADCSLPLKRVGLMGLAVILLVAALTVAYARLSATWSGNSDDAGIALEGDAMLHGNVLLHGWAVTEDSYLTTEVPIYAAAVAVRGLVPGVSHEVAALLYAVLVVVAMLLAGRGSLGLLGWLRMLIPLALLVALLPGPAVGALLMGPHHISTVLLILLGLLALDRTSSVRRGTAVAAILLALNQVADPLATYVGVIPIALVSGIRLLRWPRRWRLEMGILAAAVGSTFTARLLLALVHYRGGPTVLPLGSSLVLLDHLPSTAVAMMRCVLVLFGADFFGRPVGLEIAAALTHLLGVAFVLGIVWLVLSRWCHGHEHDRVTQILVMTILVDVAAYLFSEHLIDLGTSRYLVPTLVCGAILGGRVGAGWLLARDLPLPPLVAVVTYCVLFSWSVTTAAPSSGAHEELGAWLEHRQLHYGLGGYWEASVITVQTGGRVRVRAVGPRGHDLAPLHWTSDASWYHSSIPGQDANFIVWNTRSQQVNRALVVTAFGAPSEVDQVGPYEVLIYDRNLLDKLAESS